MYGAALARVVLTDADHDKIAEQVRKLRERHPDASRPELAERLIRQTALRGALIGAVTSAPPGLFSVVPLAADVSYQAMALNRLVQAIAQLYGRPTGPIERAGAVAASVALEGGTEFLRRTIVKGVARSLRRRRVVRLVPIFGALLGGVASYVMVTAAGREAHRLLRPHGIASRARAILNR
jgi:uncharacterized membrane protein YcjF (UPF0283 family)